MREEFEQALRDGIAVVVECDTPELSIEFWDAYIEGTTTSAKPRNWQVWAADYRFEFGEFQGYNHHHNSDYRCAENQRYYNIQRFFQASEILAIASIEDPDLDLGQIM